MVFFLFLFPFSIFSESESIKIEWEKISDSKKTYILEIQNEKGETIVTKKTKDNFIEAILEPGSYSRRLSILNKLEEIETISEWIPFKVLLKEGIMKIKLSWQEIPEAHRYLLEIKDKEGKIIKSKKLSKNSTNIYIKPGDYKRRLTVLNKLDEEESSSGWESFKVIQIHKPVLKEPTAKTDIEKKEKTMDWTILKISSVIPGGGQIYAGLKHEENSARVRGYIYSGSFLFTGILFYCKKKELETATNDYHKSIVSAFTIPIFLERNYRIPVGLLEYSIMQNKYNHAKQIFQEGTQLEDILVGIYLIQLVDSYLLNRRINLESESDSSGFYLHINSNKINSRDSLATERTFHFGYTFTF